MIFTRAPLRYFYNAPHGGGLFRAPLLISETTGPIVKIQTAFESPGKTVEGKQIYWPRGHEWRHRSGQSQNVRLFGLGDIGEQNCNVKLKQSQRIGMDSVSDIFKYHLLCFVTIIEVKVISGHQVKRSSKKISWFRAAIHAFRSNFRKEREKWP